MKYILWFNDASFLPLDLLYSIHIRGKRWKSSRSAQGKRKKKNSSSSSSPSRNANSIPGLT